MEIILTIHIICFLILQPTILRNNSHYGNFYIADFIFEEIYMLIFATITLFFYVGTIIAYKYEEVSDRFDKEVFKKKNE